MAARTDGSLNWDALWVIACMLSEESRKYKNIFKTQNTFKRDTCDKKSGRKQGTSRKGENFDGAD
jgi:hypothetical protein